MKKFAVGLVLFVIAAGLILVYDDQSVKFDRLISRMASDIKETERLLEQAAVLAPRGDIDMKGLHEAISDLDGRLAEVLSSFPIPATIDADLLQYLSGSLAGGARMVELKPLALEERDFYREHKYLLLLAGPVEAVSSTIRGIEHGPLLVSLEKVAFGQGARNDATVEVWLTAYSVVTEPTPNAKQGLPSCGVPRTDVLLPWLRRKVDALQAQRESLCLQGARAPARTEAIIRYEQLRLQDRSARITRGAIRDTRQDAEQVIKTAIRQKGF